MAFIIDDTFKNDYLDYIKKEYSEHNLRLAEFTLKATDLYESIVNGSVYNFNKENMLALLGSFNATSINNMIVYKSALLQYLMWVSNKTSSIGLISLNDINTDDLSMVINKKSRLLRYVTKNEYMDFLKTNIDNIAVQDLAMVVLLWNGIKGSKYEDLRSVKVTDYDKNAGVLYTPNRTIELSNIEREIITKTVDSCIYENIKARKLKDETEEKKPLRGAPVIHHYDLDRKIEFMIKPLTESRDNRETDQKVKIRILNMFKSVKNSFLTGGGIYTSGCIYRMLEDNNFEPKGYTEITNYMKVNGYVVAACKCTELQDIMLEKLKREK